MSFLQPKKSKFGYLTIITIALFIHALIIWLFTSGLVQKVSAYIEQPMNASLIEEVKHLPKPETPKQKIVPKVYVAKADVEQQPIPSPVQATIAPTQTQASLTSAPSSPSATIVNLARIDMSGGCQRPEYPEYSRIDGEQGSVTVGFLIAADGKIKESKIITSSGFRRLDTAARDAFVLCKFQPGTEDGRAVESWAKIKYTWRLN
jgi:protein TonB